MVGQGRNRLVLIVEVHGNLGEAPCPRSGAPPLELGEAAKSDAPPAALGAAGGIRGPSRGIQAEKPFIGVGVLGVLGGFCLSSVFVRWNETERILAS